MISGDIRFSLFAKIYHCLWLLVDWIFPPHCPACNSLGHRWCPQCQAAIPQIQSPFCQRCHEPLFSEERGKPCHCSETLHNLQMIRAFGFYSPPLSNAIRSLKYHRNIGIAESLANNLVELYNTLNWEADLVISVPLSSKRQKDRGYNQASLIARPFALAIKKPFLPKALIRMKDTESQVGLSRSERSSNVNGAFRANPDLVMDKRIILIDDVSTTGATLEACATALKNAGAKAIVGLTLARAVHTRNGFSDQLVQSAPAPQT